MAERHYVADKGMVYTDKATETLRAKELYLGIHDSIDNYKQIPEDTPIPEPPEPESEVQTNGV